MRRIIRKRFKTEKIFGIYAAKTPIIRIEVINYEQKFEYDICCINENGLKNSKLFKIFADFNADVQILGYKIKVFSKQMKINGYKEKFISSYAYLILL